MNLVKIALVLVLPLLAGCRSPDRDGQLFNSDSLPLVGSDLGVFFPSRKVQVYNLSEKNPGRWFCLEATEAEFGKLLREKGVSAVPIGQFSVFDGSITTCIQFDVPRSIESGWSVNTVKASLRMGKFGVYVFFDKETGRIAMCVFL